ncbi:uncharacterized protein LOC114768451 [Denticeps clupeoides]|uniref:uncharacterized protein LOC114768451 n=1 Tax=Denticeps clupeoides TaxID=299321 RepID=UPI0010A30320|nr:uncharacterized protein LOC114768451 [Denticeps clupeoides]
MSWYKQVLGQKPRCMANVERLQQVYFFEEFHDPRFRAIRSHGQLILTVTNITKPDEATYYCSVRYFDQLIFGSGTFLMVKAGSSEQLISSFNHSDGKAFYCAVAECAELNSENRTNINLETPVDPVFVGLIAALGLCFAVILSLVQFSLRRRRCKHCRAAAAAAAAVAGKYQHDSLHDKDGDLINYASVHLPEKGHKRALQKKAPQQNTLYSEVKYSVKSNVSVHNYC